MQIPFDPIALAKETEKQVIDGDRRKYNTFRVERFYGQTATARGVGCNSRCVFCWINPSRDSPADYGSFHSPEEVYEKLVEVASNKYGRLMYSSVARISGCEPTIGKDHLLSLIDVLKTKYDALPPTEFGKEGEFTDFLLETNGFLLGNDPSYIRELRKFGKYVRIRLSFKAGTPEDLERKTGIDKKAFELPFLALRQLAIYRMNYGIAAMSADPVLMPENERRSLLESIANTLGFIPEMEEEEASPFGVTVRRLAAAGYDTERLGKQRYEYILNSLERQVKPPVKLVNRMGNLSTNPPEALRQLLHHSEFKVKEIDRAQCGECRNPFHGFAEDDLDSKLD